MLLKELSKIAAQSGNSRLVISYNGDDKYALGVSEAAEKKAKEEAAWHEAELKAAEAKLRQEAAARKAAEKKAAEENKAAQGELSLF